MIAHEPMTVRESCPKPMKTLYDLLDARPDDDAERLRTAFRKAAKANRTSPHAGHPDASERFGQIVEAYDILRNAEHRAAYDRLLEFDRGGFSSKINRAISFLVHNIVSDAIGVVGLVVVLAGGHTLFAHISKTPVNAFDVTARGQNEVASVHPPVGTNMFELVEPRDKLEHATVLDRPMMPSAEASATKGDNTLGAAKGGPASGPAGPGIEIAKTDDAFAARVDHDQARSGDAPLSSQKEDNDVPKASLSDFAKSVDKHDFEIPDIHNINRNDVKIPSIRNVDTNDMKISETKISGKPRVEAKRQAKNRTPVKQASLEDRKMSACSGRQACAGESPVFGVGF
jgi:curved DNA-binding protein CbpA